ncbi:hypothetical protein [Mesorhizobium sp. DCY119]|uniref:hypothetical protein n=1 Tax=Mesorhizobium sp. DCY119 TaxID=2108445 RepID=UPI000E6D3CF6|nr:hypothetical protein [Mesorhizobium sp. DCY119]RJG45865.1 hypothetical protein D3Y55_17480 [Mesorhizobium sp. DCY119]
MDDWSISQFCTVAGINRKTEYRWRKEGKGPAYTLQIGKHTYVRYPIGLALLWINQFRPERAEAAISLWLDTAPDEVRR